MTAVLIVDDHPVFRRGMAALLRAAGFDVAGEAATAAEALSLALQTRPDVVLMDLGLPDRSGIAATEQIRAAVPSTRVVVVTMHDDDGSVRAALAAGAHGFVVKDALPEEIVAAVQAAMLGARLLGSGVTNPEPGSGIAPDPYARFRLTPRERQLADLLAKGLTNQVIAMRLDLSGKTIANYVSALLVKLGVADRDEAIAVLRRTV